MTHSMAQLTPHFGVGPRGDGARGSLCASARRPREALWARHRVCIRPLHRETLWLSLWPPHWLPHWLSHWPIFCVGRARRDGGVDRALRLFAGAACGEPPPASCGEDTGGTAPWRRRRGGWHCGRIRWLLDHVVATGRDCLAASRGPRLGRAISGGRGPRKAAYICPPPGPCVRCCCGG